MSIIVGIDVGTVRVGCAISDATIRIPFPFAVWPRAAGRAEAELLALIKEREPALLVVGLPLGPNGERTTMCERVEAFVARIVKRIEVRVAYVDESFSSVEAIEKMGSNGKGSRDLDSKAACNILEAYFASNEGPEL